MGHSKQHTKEGFTLIELLVVISIIAFLSSIIFASLRGARLKARDTARILGVGALRNPLELFSLDSGHYPNTPNPMLGNHSIYFSYIATWDTILGSELLPYLRRMPQSSWPNEYVYVSGPPEIHAGVGESPIKCVVIESGYYLNVRLENSNYASRNDGGLSDARYEQLWGDVSIVNTPCGLVPFD